MAIFEFTALSLQAVGGAPLSVGDAFGMPLAADATLTVTDDDAALSGDLFRNDFGDDRTQQTAAIFGAGSEAVETRIFAERRLTLEDAAGNRFTLIEIVSADDTSERVYAFLDRLPAQGAALRVIKSENALGDGMTYADFSAGLTWKPNGEGLVLLEAEDMVLNGYVEAADGGAAGDARIETAGQGEASIIFGGESGTLTILIDLIDTGPGNGRIELLVNGQLITDVTLNQSAGGVQRLTLAAPGVELATGDEIAIRGVADGQDRAAVDRLIFVFNEAPIAADDVVTTDEDTAVQANILANDEDPDGDPLTLATLNGEAAAPGGAFTSVISDGGRQAEILFQQNGDLSFTPQFPFQTLARDEIDNFTLDYTVVDDKGGVDTARVTFEVQGLNDAPDFEQQTFFGVEDRDLQGAIFAEDIDGDALTFTLAQGPQNGAVTLNANGTFTYQPDQDFNGSDFMLVTASDGLEEITQSVNFVLDPRNDAPIAQDFVGETDEDTALVAALAAFDVDGDDLVFEVVAGPQNGDLALDLSGTFTYTPDQDFNGEDGFTFTVTDGFATAGGTAAISVAPVNDAPTVDEANSDLFVQRSEDEFASDGTPPPPPGFGPNILRAAPRHGDQDAPFWGPKAVEFIDVGIVFVSLEGVIRFDDPDIGDLHALQIVDAVGSGDPVVLDGVDLFSLLTLTPGADGRSFDWTFTADPSGVDELSQGDFVQVDYLLELSDNGLPPLSDVTTLTFRIDGVNDAPIPDFITDFTLEDTVLNGQLSAFDPDFDDLTFALNTVALNGQVQVNADGTFTYTPDADFNGFDTFRYQVSDGIATVVGDVEIFVDPVNDAPIAVDDFATVNEDDFAFVNLIANDIDIDSGFLTVQPQFAVEVVSQGGRTVFVDLIGEELAFDPTEAFNDLALGDTDSFTVAYTVEDDFFATDTGFATITVEGRNDAPELDPQTSFAFVELREDDAVDPLTGLVTLNAAILFEDPDLGDFHSIQASTFGFSDVRFFGGVDPLEFVTFGPAANGEIPVTIAFDPVLLDPLSEFSLVSFFVDYTVIDDKGGVSGPGSLAVDIFGANDAPVVADQAFAGVEDADVTGQLVAADVDLDDFLSFNVFTNPTNGQVTIFGDGTFAYTPDPDFNGQDAFTFSVFDGFTEVTATATITVEPVNDAPVAADDDVFTDEDTALVIDVLADNGFGPDFDVDGDQLIVTEIEGVAFGPGAVIALASGATVSFGQGGEAIYDPNGAFDFLAPGFGSFDQFTYAITDGVETSIATVFVNIDGVNDAPVTVGEAFTVSEDQIFSDNLLANDLDAEGDILEIVDGGGDVFISGTFFLNSAAGRSVEVFVDFNGAVDFNLNDAFNDLAVGETDTVTLNYEVTDFTDIGAPVQAVFTVEGANDAPLFGAGADTFLGRLENDPTAVFGLQVIDVDTSDVVSLNVQDALFNGQVPAGLNGVDPATLLTFTPAGDRNFNVNFALDPTLVDGMTDGEFMTVDYLIGVEDGNGGTDVTTFTLQIAGQNDAPIATDEAFQVTEDEVFFSSNLLANDVDPEGDLIDIVDGGGDVFLSGSFFLTSVGGRDVEVAVQFDGTVDFNLNDAFDDLAFGETDTVTLNYQITDNAAPPVDAQAVFTIDGVNDPALFSIETQDIVAPTTESFPDALEFFLADDPDASDVVTIGLQSAAFIGDVPSALNGLNAADFITITPIDARSADVSFVIDPALLDGLSLGQQLGVDMVLFADDGVGLADFTSFVVDIAGENDAPVAVSDNLTTVEDTALNGQLAAVDPDEADVLTFADIGDTAGDVTINADGSFTYTPPPNFNGQDFIDFSVDDGNGGLDFGQIVIDVTPVNDPPQLTAPEVTPFANPITTNAPGQIDNTNDAAEMAGAVFGDGSFATVDKAGVGQPTRLNIFDATGAFQQSVNVSEVAGSSNDAGQDAATLLNGNVVVSYVENRGSFFTRVFDSTGAAQTVEIQVNSAGFGFIDNKAAVAATADGGFAAAFVGFSGENQVILSRFDQSGNLTLAETRLDVAGDAAEGEIDVVGLEFGDVAVAYIASPTAGGTEVRLSVVNGQGGLLAQDVVLSTGVNGRAMSITELAFGELVVVYEKVSAAGVLTPHAIIVDSFDGSVIVPEFEVVDFTGNTFDGQLKPEVIADPSGGFVVSFANERFAQTDNETGLQVDPGVVIRQFNDDGTPKGNAIFVSAGTQHHLAFAPSGELMIALLAPGNVSQLRTVTLPDDPFTLAEDTFADLEGFSVADVDVIEGTGEVAVTFAVQNGTLFTEAAGQSVIVNGDFTNTMTISGLIDEVNQTIGLITYTPDIDFNGTDTLDVTVDDLGNAGGPPETASLSIPITVTPVNDAPTLNAAASDQVGDVVEPSFVFNGDFEAQDVAGTGAGPVDGSFQIDGVIDGFTVFGDAGVLDPSVDILPQFPEVNTGGELAFIGLGGAIRADAGSLDPDRVYTVEFDAFTRIASTNTTFDQPANYEVRLLIDGVDVGLTEFRNGPLSGETVTERMFFDMRVVDTAGFTPFQSRVEVEIANISEVAEQQLQVDNLRVEGGSELVSDAGVFVFEDIEAADTHSVTIEDAFINDPFFVLPQQFDPFAALTLGGVDQVADSFAWTFETESATFGQLGDGETVVVDYTLRIADDGGAFTDELLTVTMTGVGDSAQV